MASPFQQAVGRPAYGFGGLPSAPTIGSYLQALYGIQVPEGAGYANLTPKQFATGVNVLEDYYKVNPEAAVQAYWQDPRNQYSYIWKSYNDWQSEFERKWTYDPQFRRQMQEAGFTSPFVPFHEYVKLAGFDPNIIAPMGELYEGGTVPEASLAKKLLQGNIQTPPQPSPQPAPTESYSNDEALKIIQEQAAKDPSLLQKAGEMFINWLSGRKK